MGKSFLKAVIYVGTQGFARPGTMMAGWVLSRIMADVGELDVLLFIKAYIDLTWGLLVEPKV